MSLPGDLVMRRITPVKRHRLIRPTRFDSQIGRPETRPYRAFRRMWLMRQITPVKSRRLIRPTRFGSQIGRAEKRPYRAFRRMWLMRRITPG